MFYQGTPPPFARFTGMQTDSSPSVHQPTVRHLEQLTAQLLDGVILIDPTGVIVSVNAAALRMHGVRSAEDLGATADDYAERFAFWGEGHRPLRRRDYPVFRLLAGESFPDLVVEVAPAGEQEARWVHQVRDVALDDDGGDPDCLALVISDVSERFNAQARFDAMFQANPAPAVVVRLRDQRIADANEGFLSLTGFDPAALKGRSVFGLGLLDAISDPAETRRRIECGEVLQQQEARLLTADGSKRLVLFAGQPIDVTEEDALLLTFADLEPRRQAQEALAASERHLSSIFQMAPVAMAVTRDADHRIASVNAAFCELTGYGDEEVVGRAVAALGLWEASEHRAAAEQQTAERGGFRNRDGRLTTKVGETVDCLVSAETISMHGTPCVLWLYQDITERRRGELELVDAVDAVMKDASWLSRSILDKLATIRRPGSRAPTADLTARERDILELVCDDLDDGEIAGRLGLSRNTVRNHVARLYAKIGVNRRSGAVIWGRERGMGRR